MPVEQREQVTHVKMEATGNRRTSSSWRKPVGFLWGGTSRMSREIHVRICGRLGVKFPGSTRQLQKAKNRVKARVRAKVEHPFRILKRVFGFEKVRHRGLKTRANQWPLGGA